jgi:hypothetical protein
MTPKEKAVELYNKYEQLGKDFTRGVSMAEFAKQCALIAVDEILNSNPHIYIEKGGSDCRGDWSYKEAQSNQLYWQEVKQEIEKL